MIDKLRINIQDTDHVTNVYLIYDRYNMLGGKEAKNAPVDISQEVWEQLYNSKTKVR